MKTLSVLVRTETHRNASVVKQKRISMDGALNNKTGPLFLRGQLIRRVVLTLHKENKKVCQSPFKVLRIGTFCSFTSVSFESVESL